jgi:Family of unknown function (DUF5313)
VIAMTVRPGPLRWLRYAFGAGLPERFDEWVYHDITSRTWVLRHLVRAIVQLSPALLAVAIFLPGPGWIRIVAIGAATPMALVFCLAYMTETTDHRLTKAGYPSGTAEAVRRERSDTAQAEGAARRREKRTARRALRRARAA